MYSFFSMTEGIARIISSWTYPEPYNLYDMDGSEECISELMNGDYFYVKDRINDLIGFVCNGNSARVPGGYEIGIYNNPDILDIGLGLHPELTGKGLGSEFLAQTVQFMSSRFAKTKFQLVVAAFNSRAMKAYEKVGFHQEEFFQSSVTERQIPFVVMRVDKWNE